MGFDHDGAGRSGDLWFPAARNAPRDAAADKSSGDVGVLGDPRWKFTSKYLGLRQDPKATNPQKTAFFNVNTWGAYLLNGDLFIKRYTADPTRTYPDMGVSFETFTNADFLELETIGPMTKLAPGATVEHVERWSLHKGVKLTEFSDAELDRAVKPLL
ncbi:MAG: hypothetical protein NTU83_13610 [Candidatus Hydrogenedentes bacterium]|nr:hypothetical protein [Candidatus Hydrogenedentota bacterium]